MGKRAGANDMYLVYVRNKVTWAEARMTRMEGMMERTKEIISLVKGW